MDVATVQLKNIDVKTCNMVYILVWDIKHKRKYSNLWFYGLSAAGPPLTWHIEYFIGKFSISIIQTTPNTHRNDVLLMCIYFFRFAPLGAEKVVYYTYTGQWLAPSFNQWWRCSYRIIYNGNSNLLLSVMMSLVDKFLFDRY